MISVLSWNIQNGKGVDGVISLRRIADVIEKFGSADVICLQEISRGLCWQVDDKAPDQIKELSGLFPDYEVLFGIAVDAASAESGGRWQFGNAVLSRIPLLSAQHHILPKPAVSGIRHMTRQATEIVVGLKERPLRIVNLHLEFHSLLQRTAQIAKLREIQYEAVTGNVTPPKADMDGPYQAVPRPVDAIYCGDFNMLVGSSEYELMVSQFRDGSESVKDAWTITYPEKDHDPTCGIHDHQSWPEGPHCRDFFFVSGECTQEVRSIHVDVDTDASDHQPLKICLERD